jgi:peptidylprolyl isomerase
VNLDGPERTLRCLFVPSQKKQWVSSRARAAAIENARRQQNRRRLLAAIGVGVLVIALVAAFALNSGGGGTKTASTPTTRPSSSTASTTVPTLASAAGKPCVAVADPLPMGAPDVPIDVGPPPAQLVVKDLKDGTGAAVTATQKLTVDYIGVSCSTGKIFDSSYKRGNPADFTLSEVIKGWQDGIVGMKVGGQRLLGIPPELAYGSNPPPTSGIAPDETLWFVVDVRSAA